MHYPTPDPPRRATPPLFAVRSRRTGRVVISLRRWLAALLAAVLLLALGSGWLLWGGGASSERWLDAVIVPGGGLDDSGRPLPWVVARLNAALRHDAETSAYLVLSRGTTHKPAPRDAAGYAIDEVRETPKAAGATDASPPSVPHTLAHTRVPTPHSHLVHHTPAPAHTRGHPWAIPGSRKRHVPAGPWRRAVARAARVVVARHHRQRRLRSLPPR